MDWVKLFALLVTIASFFDTTEGVKKKIRIHLPQKVKHIHHHKKVYITNHPATSQYAPAYMPTAEGAVAMPTTVALSQHHNILPLKPDHAFDGRHHLAASSIASKLLPMYRARGYYGPTPSSDWDEHEYDLVPPPETGPAGFVPSAFSAPSAPAASPNYPPKRVKIVKVEPTRKKKVVRKRKPKRIVQEAPPTEEEHPVSTFHEQFYSDLDSTGTIKKVRKPKRIEKIIDGDTEHIHTYSEEHIHKVVFDDPSKLTGLAGADPAGGVGAFAAAHPLIPIKNVQALLAVDPTLAVSSVGTPHHMEYASYNPREVTHDHVFHDHGELPPNMDLAKDGLGFPPKVSYDSQGLRISANHHKFRKNKTPKYSAKPGKATPTDFSYYENIYTPNGQPKGVPSDFKYGADDEFTRYPQYGLKDKSKNKPYYGNVKTSSAFHLGQASMPIPFSTLSTYGNPFDANSYKAINSPSAAGFSSYKDPFSSFKGIYSNNYEYDNYASPSNYYNKDTAGGSWPGHGNQGKKKSVSTQNVRFGTHDHKMTVDHLADSSHIAPTVQQSSPSQLNFAFEHSSPGSSATPPTHFTITENSPGHEYYTAMALKAFQEEADPLSVPEASNTNFQFAEAPSDSTPEPSAPSMASTAETPRYFEEQITQQVSSPTPFSDYRKPSKRRRPKNHSGNTQSAFNDELKDGTQESETQRRLRQNSSQRPQTVRYHHGEGDDSTRGKFKYGDKI